MPTLAANHPRVLLVDDNETNRVFLSALCENLGYAVVHASSGDEALLLCQFAKQPFIAALIDQVMPQMDGWELLKRLRQMEGFGATASVLISASPPCRPIDFPASVNFDLMLTKPFEESILMCFLCHELADVPRNAQNCWHLQKGPIQPVRTILPEYELQTFAELLDMGRLMRLTEWARKLSAQNEYAQVSTQIIQLTESADLPGLRNLLTQLRHSSTQIHSDNQGK